MQELFQKLFFILFLLFIFIVHIFDPMGKAIISEAKQKRLDRFASIKTEFDQLIKDGGDRTAVIKDMAKNKNMSIATIYKAIK